MYGNKHILINNVDQNDAKPIRIYDEALFLLVTVTLFSIKLLELILKHIRKRHENDDNKNTRKDHIPINYTKEEPKNFRVNKTIK